MFYLQETEDYDHSALMRTLYGYDVSVYRLYDYRDRPVICHLDKPMVYVSHEMKLISLYDFEDMPTSIMYCTFKTIDIIHEMYPDYLINDTTTSNRCYLRYLETKEEE